jgi:hypothetical protein
MGRVIVWASILLYLGVVVIGGRDLYFILFSHLPEDASSLRLDAFAIRALIVAPTTVCIFGLAHRTRWGLRAAVSWNVGLVIMLVVAPFSIAAALVGLHEAWSTLSVPALIVGPCFAVLAIVLKNEHVRQLFPNHA